MTYIAEFDKNRKFGVEVEVYGVTLDRIAKTLARNKIYGWKLVGDDSIVGEHSIELVSPALLGHDGMKQIISVFTLLEMIGAQVNDSCGFHVHHCIEDYTGKNMVSLLRLYTKFEKVIDYLVAPSRRGDDNKHCRSLVKDDTLQWIQEIERPLAVDVAIAFSLRTFDSDWQRQDRRHKLNVLSYPQHGTVEFRHHQGTLSFMEAGDWVLFTQLLVSKAKQTVISGRPSHHPTLGELMRSLKLKPHQRFDKPDVLIDNFTSRLRKRYAKNMGW